jgi:hypothetical protein
MKAGVRRPKRVREACRKPATEKEIMTMRFMMMVKHAENQGPPPQELMDAMAKITEEAVQGGTLLGSGGLAPLAQGSRIRISKGQLTVTDGPFTEAKEVVGGFAQFELKSKQEAIEGAVQFMELHRKHWPGWEGETEVRQIFGPEEFAQCVEERSKTAAR